MIGRPSCHLRLNAAKAELGQVKLIDQHIDRPDRIVLAQIVIQPLRKQSALTAVIANDKARHRILRPNRRRIISLMVFSHSLGQKQTSSREFSTSALPSTADIHQGDGNVSFVPNADVSRCSKRCREVWSYSITR